MELDALVSARIIAVSLIYKPDFETLGAQIEALCSQVDAVLVINNGAESDLRRLESRFADESKVMLKQLPHNVGVAAGFNEGILAAQKLGSGYILLMDQDSIPELGMVAGLAKVHLELARLGVKTFAVGPRYSNHNSSDDCCLIRVRNRTLEVVPVNGKDDTVEDCSYLISSGCLVSTAAIEEVGGMLEGLFIDLVDIEWGFRAGSMGYTSYLEPKVVLAHSLGEHKKSVRIVSKTHFLTMHNPFRYYYMWRNIILLRRLNHIPACFSRYMIMSRLKHLLLSLVACDQRFKVFCFSVQGVIHGLAGRSGELRYKQK